MCDSAASMASAPGEVSRRRSTPFVQNNNAHSGPALLSRRIWYPTEPTPICSPRSAATRSETVTAEMRRGCVHMIAAPRPRAQASSIRYCGTCVVLPHPVAPATSTTWCACAASSKASRNARTGSASRWRWICAKLESLAARLRVASARRDASSGATLVNGRMSRGGGPRARFPFRPVAAWPRVESA